jgi:hypothetical protein
VVLGGWAFLMNEVPLYHELPYHSSVEKGVFDLCGSHFRRMVWGTFRFVWCGVRFRRMVWSTGVPRQENAAPLGPYSSSLPRALWWS